MKKQRENSTYDTLFNYMKDEPLVTDGVPRLHQNLKNDKERIVNTSRLSLWRNFPFNVYAEGESVNIVRLYKI